MKVQPSNQWQIKTSTLAIFACQVTMILSVIAWSYWSQVNEIERDLDEYGRLVATTLATNSEYSLISGNFSDFNRAANKLMHSNRSIHSIEIQNDAGKTVLDLASDTNSEEKTKEFSAEIRKDVIGLNYFGISEEPHIADEYSASSQGATGPVIGYVHVQMTPSAMLGEKYKRIIVGTLIGLAFTALIGVLFVQLLRDITVPLGAIIDAVREIRAGNYRTRLEVSSGGEIGELLSSINDMSESLEESTRNLENKVFERTQELEASRNAALEADSEKRRLIQQVNSIIEEERKSIAIEIHDVINSIVIGIRSDSQTILNIVSKTQPTLMMDEIVERAKSITSHANDVYANCRAIVTRLRPEVLDVLGLEQAIEELVQTYNSSSSSCIFAFHATGDASQVDPSIGIAAYRITQEALSNVVKHSGAQHADVSLRVRSDELRIAIEDDGSGFSKSLNESGFGVIGMRERVVALGGTLDVMSGPDGGGTRVIAHIPLKSLDGTMSHS